MKAFWSALLKKLLALLLSELGKLLTQQSASIAGDDAQPPKFLA